MNQTQDNLTQDDDLDRTMADEVQRVRMGAILDLPTFGPERPSSEGQSALSSIGKTWARSGLLAGKNALKTSAGTLERAACLLNHLAMSLKRAEQPGRG